jgi:gas vesicle protein
MSRDSRAESIIPFVLGVGLGALGALFLAPKAGEDLRSDIGEGVGAAADQLRASGRDIKQGVEKMGAQVYGQVHEAVEAGQNAYQQAKNG